MRIVMVMVVRDEADIIGENLAFHLSRGVDLAIVADHGSNDATAETLCRHAAAGRVRRIEAEGRFDPGRWLNEMARLAVEEEGADWVLPNDADEFFFPREGTLAEILARAPEGVGALACRRHNFVPTADEAEPWFERMTRRRRVSLNARGRPLPGKVVHRAHPGLAIKMGNHRRVGPEVGATVQSEEIEVLHFQMRTYEQFERSVVRIGLARAGAPRGGGGARAEQFRRWLAGELPAYYAEEIRAVADSVEDARLRCALRGLHSPLAR